MQEYQRQARRRRIQQYSMMKKLTGSGKKKASEGAKKLMEENKQLLAGTVIIPTGATGNIITKDVKKAIREAKKSLQA